MAVIYCFGDSITYGAWDIDGGGWATRLRKDLDSIQEEDPNLYFMIYNLGISGETTDGLVGRLEQELAERKRGEEEHILIFAYGANDCVFVPSLDDFAVPIDRFSSNLELALDQVSSIAKRMVMINITPVDEVQCQERYLGKDKVRLNKYVEDYNDKLGQLARARSASLVDVHSAFMTTDYENFLSEDGLHPNSLGHEKISNLVSNTLNLA